MSYSRLLSALTCAMALTAGCDDPGSDTVTFVVAVQELPPATRRAFLERNGPTDTLRLTLPGEGFDPPLDLRQVPRDSVDRTTPLGAEIASFSALRVADRNWIIESFAEADRREILSFLSDSAVREGSRRMFERIDRTRVYAITEQRVGEIDYRLVFFSYRRLPREGNVHAYVLERGEWKRTNQLSRDADVTLALHAFRKGQIQTQ